RAHVLRRFLAMLAAWFTSSPGAPHGGETVPPGETEPPHGGEIHLSPQQIALSSIARVWKEQATTEIRNLSETVDARMLACRFRACLQSEPALIGWRIPCEWVQDTYPVFCAALNVELIPYKDFAKELAEVMPRKRLEHWEGGKRLGTHRYYL